MKFLVFTSYFLVYTFAFVNRQNFQQRKNNESQKFGSVTSPSMLKASDTDDHMLAATSFMSHIMLKVPSVDATVDYWVEKGGVIRRSTPMEDSQATNGAANGASAGALRSAFVELGCAMKKEGESPVCFALELVSSAKKDGFMVGNAISYLGVSMLLQFQNNLLGAITGDEKPASQGDEPNGIQIKSSASAPGDLLARVALRTKDLEATHTFYTSILGMEAKAEDENMLCLRYDNDCFTGGVPTTLVFDRTTEDIVIGDCFDHFVIATSTDIETLYSTIESQRSSGLDFKLFMKPTDMFGKKVMGLIDPNGYKVILASN